MSGDFLNLGRRLERANSSPSAPPSACVNHDCVPSPTLEEQSQNAPRKRGVVALCPFQTLGVDPGGIAGLLTTLFVVPAM